MGAWHLSLGWTIIIKYNIGPLNQCEHKRLLWSNPSHAGLLVAEAERSACQQVSVQRYDKTKTLKNNKQAKHWTAAMTSLARGHKSEAGRWRTRQPLNKNLTEKSNTYHTCNLGAKKQFQCKCVANPRQSNSTLTIKSLILINTRQCRSLTEDKVCGCKLSSIFSEKKLQQNSDVSH